MRSLCPVLLLLLCTCCWAESGPVVQTKYGKVKGKYVDQAQVFKSIPFAGPVSGPNRWRDPQPPVAWLGTLDGTEDPPACPQDCRLHGCPIPDPEVMDEECLFLNVYAPQNASPESKLPVLVFIHGGGYTGGASSYSLYDSSYLAVHSNIVVVTTNYRLGALGFLLYGSGSDAITGNFGIKDQLFALQWIQDNIRLFGGDPSQVTLSGESAGAMSVAIHVTNTQTSGLFHKAIIQSNPFTSEYKLVPESLKKGDDFAKILGCPTPGAPECLRSKDVKEIVEGSSIEKGLTWAPVVNGAEVPGQPLALFQSGHFRSEVPVIMGTTSAEGAFFVYHFMRQTVPASLYRAALAVFFGAENVDEALKIYPEPSDGEDIRPQLSEIVSDLAFYCTTVLSAKSAHRNSPSTPVYFYIFNHSFPQPKQGSVPLIKIPECFTEACHAAELLFVFHNVDEFACTQEELNLADSVSQFWGNFVKYGSPNGQSREQGEGYCAEEECKGAQAWPLFSNSTDWSSMTFEPSGNRVESDYRQAVCDAVNAIGYESDVFKSLFQVAFMAQGAS